MKNCFIALLTCIAFVVAGCGATVVGRVKPDETIDLSGKWNDTDSRLVSEEMINDALNRPWLSNFKRNNKWEMPVVIVGKIQNRSHEHINVQTFVKDLERALINSGEVEFVASKGEREEIREERKDQTVHASEDTAKAMAEETGADYMLKGSINSIQDKVKGKEVMFYQVNLELMHMETHKKAWIGEKKIKKFIRRARARFL